MPVNVLQLHQLLGRVDFNIVDAVIVEAGLFRADCPREGGQDEAGSSC